jgi:hypothetical protein
MKNIQLNISNKKHEHQLKMNKNPHLSDHPCIARQPPPLMGASCSGNGESRRNKKLQWGETRASLGVSPTSHWAKATPHPRATNGKK